MYFVLMGSLFFVGIVAGLFVVKIMDRNDVLYHCPRCKRRDEETVEKCRAQINKLLSESKSVSFDPYKEL